MRRDAILLTTEGTYPCYRGGVSVWCDQLIRHMDEHSFHVFAITHSPSQPRCFPFRPNTISTTLAPLWGTEEPGLRKERFSKVYRRKLRTDARSISGSFAPPFSRVVRCLLSSTPDPESLGQGLLALHRYFRDYDYAASTSSPQAWDIFLSACLHHLPPDERPSLGEATTCMRWLQRYLSILAVPLPEVSVVHSSMAGLAGVPGVLAKLLQGSAFLLSEHGIYLRELYMALGRERRTLNCRRFLLRLNSAIVGMNYHFADVITALGEYNRLWQMRLGADPAKIRIVPNGVDSSVFFPRARELPARPTILTMARTSPLKGITTLIRAAEIVRAEVPDLRVCIMGDAADEEYARTCKDLTSRLRLEDTVEFGLTDEPAEAYSRAHVYCSPSLTEAMPYSVLEAMFSGCPVVATSVGCVSEVLQDAGLLAAPNDPKPLANQLIRLLAGPHAESLRLRLADAALRRARSRYELTQVIDQYRSLYDEWMHAALPAKLSQSAG